MLPLMSESQRAMCLWCGIGDSASIKLESFPVHTFHGVVPWLARAEKSSLTIRVFVARVDVPNGEGSVAAGHAGVGEDFGRVRILPGTYCSVESVCGFGLNCGPGSDGDFD